MTAPTDTSTGPREFIAAALERADSNRRAVAMIFEIADLRELCRIATEQMDRAEKAEARAERLAAVVNVLFQCAEADGQDRMTPRLAVRRKKTVAALQPGDIE